MKKKIQKYVFYGGGAFGVALMALALSGLGETQANSVTFLSQSITSNASPAELGQYQQLDCNTLHYDIAHAQLFLSGELSESVQLVFGRVSGKGTWDQKKKREVGRSEPVQVRQREAGAVVFTFGQPVDITTLCPSAGDMAYFRLEGVQTPGLFIHGSNTDTYAGPLYNCVLPNGLPCTGTIIDMGFSLLTLPNNPPVIEQIGEQEVREMETLRFTLRASDPDGDTVTWGSGNLPEGASLNETSGEFEWTPTSDQVKDYKVTFTATDNGGPVQETSSITVFIHVVEQQTLPEENELLVDVVLSFGLEHSVENSYIAHLKNVETFIEREQFTAAENQLNVFGKKLDDDYQSGVITEQQHDILVQGVEAVLQKFEK